MIGWIRGVLRRREPGRVIVDAGGVGYELEVPLATLDGLPGEGEVVTLEVLTVFRAESLQLFGFATRGEKRLFVALTGISGIGPRLALAVLSTLSPEEIARAARDEDAAPFEAVPGIGKKTARRIVLDLRDRLGETLLELAGTAEAAAPVRTGAGGLSPEEEDAVAALLNLGYKRTEAEAAVREAAGAGGTDDLGALLRAALRRLGGRG